MTAIGNNFKVNLNNEKVNIFNNNKPEVTNKAVTLSSDKLDIVAKKTSLTFRGMQAGAFGGAAVGAATAGVLSITNKIGGYAVFAVPGGAIIGGIVGGVAGGAAVHTDNKVKAALVGAGTGALAGGIVGVVMTRGKLDLGAIAGIALMGAVGGLGGGLGSSFVSKN